MSAAKHYTLDRRPAVVVFGSAGAAVDAALELEEQLCAELDATVALEPAGECVVFPPPHRVYREGRSLRGEEYESYEGACERAAAAVGARAVRYQVEEMYCFEWEAFGRREWSALGEAYASLPGWLGARELPRWFGEDERLGPCVWASVEPPGLQVVGLLELPQWERSHQQFVAAVARLPFRELT